MGGGWGRKHSSSITRIDGVFRKVLDHDPLCLVLQLSALPLGISHLCRLHIWNKTQAGCMFIGKHRYNAYKLSMRWLYDPAYIVQQEATWAGTPALPDLRQHFCCSHEGNVKLRFVRLGMNATMFVYLSFKWRLRTTSVRKLSCLHTLSDKGQVQQHQMNSFKLVLS